MKGIVCLTDIEMSSDLRKVFQNSSVLQTHPQPHPEFPPESPARDKADLGPAFPAVAPCRNSEEARGRAGSSPFPVSRCCCHSEPGARTSEGQSFDPGPQKEGGGRQTRRQQEEQQVGVWNCGHESSRSVLSTSLQPARAALSMTMVTSRGTAPVLTPLPPVWA